MGELLNLTLGELTERFGSSRAFRDWLQGRKLAAEVKRLESRNLRDAGRLISRELVRLHVFGHIEQLHRRLLGAASNTIAVRVGAAQRGSAPVTNEEASALVRSIVALELKHAKRNVAVGLRAARTVEPPPVSEEDNYEDEDEPTAPDA